MTVDEPRNDWDAIMGSLGESTIDSIVGPCVPCAEQLEFGAAAQVAHVLEAMRLNPDAYTVLFALPDAGHVRLAESGELVDCGRAAVLMARTSSIKEGCADPETYAQALVPELILNARLLLIGFPEDAMPVVVVVV